jgi:hypothetical protein
VPYPAVDIFFPVGVQRARLLVAQGKPDQVLMLLERLREKAQAGGGAMVR